LTRIQRQPSPIAVPLNGQFDPADDWWQTIQQTSPEMAGQVRIIRVRRPSSEEPHAVYPNTSDEL
jgi:hypothetical protein